MPALLILLGACAGIPPEVGSLTDGAPTVEIERTPFYPQDRYQCGPAALATILDHSGVEVELDTVVEKVFLPGRQGSLQVEMLAATRTSGRIPYLLDGTLRGIHKELEAGRPVLVLQNLGVRAFPSWHYAVVVGIDTVEDEVILRSGRDRRRVTPSGVFARTWARSDYWAFVALRPGELPADADRLTYLKALSAFGTANPAHPDNVAAWEAAHRRWPADSTVLFGYASALDDGNLPDQAEELYRAVIDAGDHAVEARNNLALLLARAGRTEEALIEIERAIQSNSDSRLDPVLLDSRRTILEGTTTEAVL